MVSICHIGRERNRPIADVKVLSPNESEHECCRCRKPFIIYKDGTQTKEECIYHYKRTFIPKGTYVTCTCMHVTYNRVCMQYTVPLCIQIRMAQQSSISAARRKKVLKDVKGPGWVGVGCGVE